VVGVDEFALRRGRRFGAIVLDMSSHRPVDVLPDHTSDTFAACCGSPARQADLP
jgi:transposase